MSVLRRFMPILLGGVFGALLVSIVPGPGGTADGGMPGTGAAQFTDSSYAGETSDTVSVATPDELARIADPMARRSAALALFEATGGDAAAADRIAAFLPEEEGLNFRIHAIAMSGARDLNGAMFSFDLICCVAVERCFARSRALDVNVGQCTWSQRGGSGDDIEGT